MVARPTRDHRVRLPDFLVLFIVNKFENKHFASVSAKASLSLFILILRTHTPLNTNTHVHSPQTYTWTHTYTQTHTHTHTSIGAHQTHTHWSALHAYLSLTHTHTHTHTSVGAHQTHTHRSVLHAYLSHTRTHHITLHHLPSRNSSTEYFSHVSLPPLEEIFHDARLPSHRARDGLRHSTQRVALRVK